MAKIVITGAGGTVGRALRDQLEGKGHQLICWNRRQFPLTDFPRALTEMANLNPDIIFNLAIASQPTGVENEGWLVTREWPRRLAEFTAQGKVKLIHTSTVMVFADRPAGPFTARSQPNASEGYGYEKRLAEESITSSDKNVVVIRLGWQIGRQAGSNNMIDYLAKQQREHGKIRVSSKFYPACSFLNDTAAALESAINLPAGIYMADSNRCWSHFDIVTALQKVLAADWIIEEEKEFECDQRMQDSRLILPALIDQLPGLQAC